MIGRLDAAPCGSQRCRASECAYVMLFKQVLPFARISQFVGPPEQPSAIQVGSCSFVATFSAYSRDVPVATAPASMAATSNSRRAEDMFNMRLSPNEDSDTWCRTAANTIASLFAPITRADDDSID